MVWDPENSNLTSTFPCRSKHEEIDLVSLEEFYKEAPPDISKAEVTMGDPHQQTLARLDWELEQRKRLCILPDLVNLYRHRPLTMGTVLCHAQPTTTQQSSLEPVEWFKTKSHFVINSHLII